MMQKNIALAIVVMFLVSGLLAVVPRSGADVQINYSNEYLNENETGSFSDTIVYNDAIQLDKPGNFIEKSNAYGDILNVVKKIPGQNAVLVGGGLSLYRYDETNGLQWLVNTGTTINDIAFNPSGTYAVIVGNNNYAATYDWNTNTLTQLIIPAYTNSLIGENQKNFYGVSFASEFVATIIGEDRTIISYYPLSSTSTYTDLYRHMNHENQALDIIYYTEDQWDDRYEDLWTEDISDIDPEDVEDIATVMHCPKERLAILEGEGVYVFEHPTAFLPFDELSEVMDDAFYMYTSKYLSVTGDTFAYIPVGDDDILYYFDDQGYEPNTGVLEGLYRLRKGGTLNFGEGDDQILVPCGRYKNAYEDLFEDLKDIVYVDSDTAYICGEKGKIWKWDADYVDYYGGLGKAFLVTSQEDPYCNFNDLIQIGTNILYAVGANGNVYSINTLTEGVNKVQISTFQDISTLNCAKTRDQFESPDYIPIGYGAVIGSNNYYAQMTNNMFGPPKVSQVFADWTGFDFYSNTAGIAVGGTKIAQYSVYDYVLTGSYVGPFHESYEHNIGKITLSWSQTLNGGSVFAYVSNNGGLTTQNIANGETKNYLTTVDFATGQYNNLWYKFSLIGTGVNTPVVSNVRVIVQLYSIPTLSINILTTGIIETNATVDVQLIVGSDADKFDTDWNYSIDFGDCYYSYSIPGNPNTFHSNSNRLATHTYHYAGDYTISAVVTTPADQGAFPIYAIKNITIHNKAPVAKISWGGGNATGGREILEYNTEMVHAGVVMTYYSDLSYDVDQYPDNIMNYIWDFGDGSAKVYTSNNSVRHTYADNGLYDLVLSCVDNGGYNNFEACQDECRVYIKAKLGNLAPSAYITGDGHTVRYDYWDQIYTTITVSGTGEDSVGDTGIFHDNIVGYDWMIFHNEVLIFSGTGPSISISPYMVGLYRIQFSVTDDDDASDDTVAEPLSGYTNGTMLIQYAPISGDWIVSNYTFVDSWEMPGVGYDDIGVFRGNVQIVAGGHLVLSGSTLLFGCTRNDEFHVEVQAEGAISITNGSTVDTVKRPKTSMGIVYPERYYYYSWTCDGIIIVSDSYIGHVGDATYGAFFGVHIQAQGSGTFDKAMIGFAQTVALTIECTNAVTIRDSGFFWNVNEYGDSGLETGCGIAIGTFPTVTISDCNEADTITTQKGKSFTGGFQNNLNHLVTYASQLTVTKSRFWNSEVSAIVIDHCNPFITENTILDFGLNGIYVETGSAPVLDHNYIKGQGQGSNGIYTRSSFNSTLNVIRKCYYALSNGASGTTHNSVDNDLGLEGVDNTYHCYSVTGATINLYYYLVAGCSVDGLMVEGAQIYIYQNGVIMGNDTTDATGYIDAVLLLSGSCLGTAANHSLITRSAIIGSCEYEDFYINNVSITFVQPMTFVFRFTTEPDHELDDGTQHGNDDDEGWTDTIFGLLGTDSWYWIMVLVAILAAVIGGAYYAFGIMKNSKLGMFIIMAGVAILAGAITLLRNSPWYYPAAFFTAAGIMMYFVFSSLGVIPSGTPGKVWAWLKNLWPGKHASRSAGYSGGD